MPPSMNRTIEHPHILLVEGRDDADFFFALHKHLGIENIDIFRLDEFDASIDDIKPVLKLFRVTEGFTKLAIVRDVDGNAESALQSLQDALGRTGFAVPQHPQVFAEGNPEVGVFLMPPDSEGSNISLEDLILHSLKGDPIMGCVDELFSCIQENGVAAKAEYLPKMQANTVMAAFQYEVKMRSYIAAKNVDEQSARKDRKRQHLSELYRMSWWNWNHDAFDTVKAFLRQLAEEGEDI